MHDPKSGSPPEKDRDSRGLRRVAPEDIEALSMSIIERELPAPRPVQGDWWLVLRRMIHAAADFELADLIEFSPLAVEAGVEAMLEGCRLVTDTRMCLAGLVSRRYDPLGVATSCFMDESGADRPAQSSGMTRTASALELAVRRNSPSVFVIGNAPTALVRLMELMDEGLAEPKLVVGMPVGFVNAAESKELLRRRGDVEYITIVGRKGGSSVAAACANALAELALGRKARAEKQGDSR
jgi:precorrin-8X/cobalt-precorrin-8 methylmutase